MLPNVIESGHWRGGHCQGAAVDEKRGFAYFSFTTEFVKTDLQGRLIGSVGGLVGHLGCISLAPDGRVYGSLEYKNDEIGRGILANLGSDAKFKDAFYLAIFDCERIARPGMDASEVMRAAYLSEVLEDYAAAARLPDGRELPHRHGCSGIDGCAIGPMFGEAPDAKKRLFVAYGVYSDVTRDDNDNQVLLRYELDELDACARPLPEAAFGALVKHAGKYFVPTGNTSYGVQNLEYDPYTGKYIMAVYRGAKQRYPNHPLFLLDAKQAPRGGVIAPDAGWEFEYGQTGVCAMGDGTYYFSHDAKDGEGWYTRLIRYRWDGKAPFVEA